MVQTITILSNGSYSPNSIIDLGNKYENVGDQLIFNIPEDYKPGHNNFAYYLTFKMTKKDRILLPIAVINNQLIFTITTSITKYSGTYEIIFLATETEIVDANDESNSIVFVSNVMQGEVRDNFLTNPVTTETLDENLKTIYDQLMALYNTVDYKLTHDQFMGPYYYPEITDGVISWTREQTSDEQPPLPAAVDIRGPRGYNGNYYRPTIADGIIKWTGYKWQDGTYIIDPDAAAVEDYNLTTDINAAVEAQCDLDLPDLVEKGLDERIKFEYDTTTQTLYIYDVREK